MSLSLRPFSAFVCVVIASLSGCASVPMQPAKFQATPDDSYALVTFVRESVFMGDGIHLYLWDGETFVGTLSHGTLVQYHAAPGPHVFMASSENWSYVKADLVAGKRYFIKANMFPGFATMRSAMVPVKTSDARIDQWPKRLPTKTIIPGKKEKYVQERTAGAATALKNFNAGAVTFAEITDEDAR
jgi:hypothetical protein